MSRLDERGFALLLAALDADPERAGARYELLHLRLQRFFGYRGHGDAAELADETLDRFGRKLAAGEAIRTGDPERFALGIARNVSREAWRRPRREAPMPEREVPVTAAGEDEEEERTVAGAALGRCLERLSQAKRHLVLAYYQGQGGTQIPIRQALAEESGLGLNALRIRVHRIRQEIEECLRSSMGTAGPA